jgi:hypothetical protein
MSAIIIEHMSAPVLARLAIPSVSDPSADFALQR